MLKIITYLIAALFLTGCTSIKQPVLEKVEIESWDDFADPSVVSFTFLSGFSMEPTQLFIQGQCVFEEKLVSNVIDGVSGHVAVKSKKNEIKIIVINGRYDFNSSFNLKDGRFFEVGYDQEQNQIYVEQSLKAHMYD